MKTRWVQLLTGCAILTAAPSLPAIDRYVSLSGGHAPPFTDWAGAATNIQEAIDASSPGDTIWVTNGVYNTGGKVMAGDLTNRVALDKAVTVQSVNGPAETIIEGVGSTLGAQAVRCAWIGDDAALVGFTMRYGATRSGGIQAVRDGGGALCNSLKSVLRNCVITGCRAVSLGGGVAGGFLRNCLLVENTASVGGGASASTLVNCTVTRNVLGSPSGYGSGVNGATLTNCIVYSNRSALSQNTSQYNASSFSFSCSYPRPSGAGNTGDDPQLIYDHLTQGSPCRWTGTAASNGSDLDGQAWHGPPSMGCYEWLPEPRFIQVFPWRLAELPTALEAAGVASGETPMAYYWLKDGFPIHSTERVAPNGVVLIIRRLDPEDGGSYSLVASNAAGIATNTVSFLRILCAAPGSGNPAPPYAQWASAAPTIQEAIDAAQPGDFILATNGVYSTGGKIMSGDLVNRAALDKPVTLLSVNGPADTIIQGAWDPATTNGPQAIRALWMGQGAAVSGFTLRGGATREASADTPSTMGGGIYADETCAIRDCIILSNSASIHGGGIYNGNVTNCIIRGNLARGQGGGARSCVIAKSAIVENAAVSVAGGASDCNLVHCTVSRNFATQAGGVDLSAVKNSIVSGNLSQVPGTDNFTNSVGIIDSYTGDMPALVDSWHIAANSPCARSANPNYSSPGIDIDGQPWGSPRPSIGCDEVYATDFAGPLAITLASGRTQIAVLGQLPLTATVSGRASRIDWDYGDAAVTRGSWFASHAWTNAGDYTVTVTAYNNDHSEGVSASLPIQVVPFVAPSMAAVSQTANDFTMSFATQWGVQYVLEQATNLAPPAAWTTVTNFIGVDGVRQVADPYATNAARFYRVRVP